MILLSIQGEDRKVAIPTDELQSRDVVGCILEGNRLLRAIRHVVDVHRDLRVRGPSLRILIGICTRVLPHAVDRHAVLVDLALIGADEG